MVDDKIGLIRKTSVEVREPKYERVVKIFIKLCLSEKKKNIR